MPLKLCILASGSSGNSIYVGSERTSILVDAGLSGREIVRRLQLVDVDIAGIRAICVTHEHDDHRSALRVLQRRHALALYANAGTIEALQRSPGLSELDWTVFSTGDAFRIGDLTLEPFSVPHDSYDPVGFVVSCEDCRIGIVTDMGTPTELIRERLRPCHALVVESNHDETMLRNSGRPWSLKQRIASRQGHLSNVQAAELLTAIAGPHLQAVFLAHMSSDCNTPELAMETVQSALQQAGHTHVQVKLTYQARPSEMIVTSVAE